MTIVAPIMDIHFTTILVLLLVRGHPDGLVISILAWYSKG
jgi:hypothetical protein